MGNSYGIRSLGTIGRGFQLLANNAGTRWKAGALTIDWDTVTAAPADVALEDGVQIASGDKYLRYGQVVVEITATGKYGPYDSGASDGREIAPIKGKTFLINETVQESDNDSNHPGGLEAGRVWRDRLMVVDSYSTVVTIDATGGFFKLIYNGQTTADIDWDASAEDVRLALEALSTVAPGDILVSQNGMAYTITWQPDLSVVPPVTASDTLTGGAGTVTVNALYGATAALTPTVALFQAALPGILYAE